MLDLTNASISDDFAASQMSSDLLSYQKNSRVMQSTLTKLFETLKSTLASEIDLGPTIINFDFQLFFMIIKLILSIMYDKQVQLFGRIE